MDFQIQPWMKQWIWLKQWTMKLISSKIWKKMMMTTIRQFFTFYALVINKMGNRHGQSYDRSSFFYSRILLTSSAICINPFCFVLKQLDQGCLVILNSENVTSKTYTHQKNNGFNICYSSGYSFKHSSHVLSS